MGDENARQENVGQYADGQNRRTGQCENKDCKDRKIVNETITDRNNGYETAKYKKSAQRDANTARWL